MHTITLASKTSIYHVQFLNAIINDWLLPSVSSDLALMLLCSYSISNCTAVTK